MSAAEFRIDQTGLPAGVNGRARSDGLASGAVVTLTATNLGAVTATFVLLWVPVGDTTAVATLAVTGNPLVWTFTPTPNRPGTYRIQLTTDVSLPSESSPIKRVFRVRTPNGLSVPALNEVADPQASLVNLGPAVVDASEDNEYVAGGPGTLGTFDYSGWFRSWHEVVSAVGDSTPVLLDIRKFGAVPGSSSYAAANAVAIQAALNQSNSSGLPVFIPPGEFWSEELILSGEEGIVGTGYQYSVLRYSKTTGDFLSYVSPSGTMEGSYFRAIALKGMGQATGTATGFRGRVAGPATPDNFGLSFQAVKVSDFPTGMVFNDSYNIGLSECSISNNGNVGALTGGGIKFERISFTGTTALANLIINSRITGNSRGIFTDNDVLDVLYGLTCETVVFDANGHGIWTAKSELLKVIGCSFANHVVAAVTSSQLLTLQSRQPAATMATTDAFVVSEQLIEFSTDLLRVAYAGVDVFSTKATATDKWSTMVANSGGLKIGVAGNVRFYSGSGTPESVVVADKGSIYIDYVTSSVRLIAYVKTTNGVNTGWQLLAYTPLFGSTGARPTPSSVPTGTTYFNTDTLLTEFSTGAAWIQYNGQLSVAGTLAAVPTATIDGALYWASDVNSLLLNDAISYRTIWSAQDQVTFANAGNYTFQNKGGRVLNKNASLVSVFTITLPNAAALENGDECVVESAGRVTGLVVSSGATVSGAPTELLANSTLKFSFIKSPATWVAVVITPSVLTTLNGLQSTGLESGGIITVSGSSQFNISAGSGRVVDNYTGPLAAVTLVSWGTFSAQTVTGIATNNQTWIGISSAGAVVQQTVPFTTAQLRTTIFLGVAGHQDHVNVGHVRNEPVWTRDSALDLRTLVELLGPATVSGNAYSANGVDLRIKKSAGSTYSMGLNYSISRQDPSVTTDAAVAPASIFYVRRNPADPSGFTIASATVASIDPLFYDDGTGTLNTVANNKYTTQWIFYYPTVGITLVQYGQTVYDSIAAAKAGINDDTFVVYPALKQIALCSRLIVKKQCTNLSLAAEALFLTTGVFGWLQGGAGGGGGGGTITGSSGTNDRRIVLGSGSSGTVIQPAAFISESVVGVVEGAVGLGLTPTAANVGATPTSTVWSDVADGRVKQGANTLAYTTETARLELQSTGLFTGGVVTINASPALFNVSAGTGQIVNNATYPPTVTNLVWSAFTGVTVTAIATQAITHLGINVSGTLVQQVVPFTLSQQRDIISFCRLIHSNNVIIDNVITNAQPAYSIGMETQGFFDIFGAVNLSGNVWSHNGANLQLTKTAGTSWSFGSNYTNSRVLPSSTTDASAGPATWQYLYRNPGSPTGFSSQANTTVVAPNSWDDGTGVIATVPNNSWTVQWIYLVPDGLTPTYRIHLGQATYATQAAARAGITSDPFSVASSLSDAVLCTRLVVQQGSTVLNGAGAQFISAGKFGAQFSGGGGVGTITGTSGTVVNRIVLGADTSGTVIKATAAVNIPTSEVIETAAGLGLPAIAANLGTAPTTTLWTASSDSRFRQGANILSYLSESGGTVTIAPTSVSTQQDNYTAGGASSTADIINASTTGADVVFTGLLATTTTPRKLLVNVGSAGSLVLKNDVTSTAANRFLTPNGRDVYLPPGGAALLSYNAVSSRWRVIFSSLRFAELSDAPSTLVAARGMVPAVNTGETAMVFAGIPSTFVTSVTNNAYAAPIAPGQTITVARWTPTTCRLRALVAPTVSTLTATVKINGSTTIGTFTLTAASLTSSAAFSVLTTRVAGDIITVELTGTDVGWSGLVIEANGTALLA
jgi:hypothetical protein